MIQDWLSRLEKAESGASMRACGLAVLTSVMLALTASSSGAIDHERFIDNRGKDTAIPRHPARDGRQGGETIGTAVVIPGLPFSDGGATCDNVDNYDAVCPYTGSTSPDVVYVYYATTTAELTIDLCASAYDTKVYVYEWPELYLPIACNDDAGCGYSGWQSRIEAVTVHPDGQYYVVVDGYGGDCGEYVLEVGEREPCVVECPPGALHEGEGPVSCEDEYYDNYNGGC